MEEDAPARRVLMRRSADRRQRGRPYMRWKNQIEEALPTIGVTNWRRAPRKIAASRNPFKGCTGHVVRMEEDAPAGRVFDAEICGSSSKRATLYALKESNRGSHTID